MVGPPLEGNIICISLLIQDFVYTCCMNERFMTRTVMRVLSGILEMCHHTIYCYEHEFQAMEVYKNENLENRQTDKQTNKQTRKEMCHHTIILL